MERIKLKTTIADEYCAASENSTIEIARLHPDPEEAGRRADALLAGGYAEPAANKKRRSSAEEQAAKARARAGDMPNAAGGVLSLEEAISALDPERDDDWTRKGKPDLNRLKELTGDSKLTKYRLNKEFPDVSRPDPRAIRIANALRSLDPENPDHWSAGGADPNLEYLRQHSGIADLTLAECAAMAGKLKIPDPREGDAGEGNEGDAGEGNEGDAGEGNEGDAGEGNEGDAGEGNEGDAGEGNEGKGPRSSAP